MPEASSKPPKLLYHSIIIVITLLTVLYVGFSPQEPSASADNALETRASITTTTIQQTLFTLPPAAAIEIASSVGVVPSSEPVPRFQALGVPGQAPPASPTPTPTVESLCEPVASQLYCVYTVRSGDSLSGIALLFGLAATNGLSAAEMLAASNHPDVIDSNTIIPGQKLRLPKSGIIHTVITAETVSQLAAGYGTTAENITAANPGSAASLAIGQEVLIPNPSRVPSITASAAPEATPAPETALAVTETALPEATPPAEATASATATATPTPVPPTVTPSRRTPTPRPATPTATPRPGTGGSSRFIWPASGPISSYFGPAHPLGIDIDFFHNPNQAVVASAAGIVSFAGGNTCCSYGLYVVIEHAGGFTTLYAHLSQVSVSAGQTVSQGQVVGLGGRTGYATGNHLHFEIRKDGNVTNPLSYLP